jgi:signal transduction protein with GAF and PtsI domain
MKYTDSYIKLADFGRELLEKKSLGEGLPHIAKYAREVIDAKRCSIYMYDRKSNKVWTTLADGIEKIVIPYDKGIVGSTIRERRPLIVNDAYSHPDFNQDIDQETGYVTVNLITAPIFGSNREVIGVLQLINKDGGFDDEDVKFMIFFAHYVSGFLELVSKYKRAENR